jgi:hypothetical protein
MGTTSCQEERDAAEVTDGAAIDRNKAGTGVRHTGPTAKEQRLQSALKSGFDVRVIDLRIA